MPGASGVALKIYQNVDGNFNAPPITDAQVIGNAIMSFDSCTSGQMTYQMIDGTFRSGVIPLSRLTQNETCSTTGPPPTNADFDSGNWFNAATSGQGLTIEVNPIPACCSPPGIRMCPAVPLRGSRATLVYGAGHIYAGYALDSGDDLRNHGRHVRHTDATGPDNHAGGQRNAGIPELLGGDVCLQFQWRKQQRLVWKHRLESCWASASRLHS